jgi:acetyl esterase/lipase
MQTQSNPETHSLVSHLHPFMEEDREPMAALRLAAAPGKGHLGSEMREPFEKLMEMTPDAPGVVYEEAAVGNVPGWWCRPADALGNAAILYFHGGAYVLGSARADRHLAGQLAARAKASVFLANYRLAPEHPYPAALEDAIAAYRGLAEEGFTAITLSGDSAGGGLALVTLSLMVAEGRKGAVPCPRGAAVMSPWTDLALTGESLETRAEADPFLTKESLAKAAKSYLGNHDSRDPLVSPLFGNLAGLPPVRIHVGEDEILLDDARRYAERLAASGGEVQLHFWEGMTHVFPSSVGTLAASAMALGDLGAFLNFMLR